MKHIKSPSKIDYPHHASYRERILRYNRWFLKKSFIAIISFLVFGHECGAEDLTVFYEKNPHITRAAVTEIARSHAANMPFDPGRARVRLAPKNSCVKINRIDKKSRSAQLACYHRLRTLMGVRGDVIIAAPPLVGEGTIWMAGIASSVGISNGTAVVNIWNDPRLVRHVMDHERGHLNNATHDDALPPSTMNSNGLFYARQGHDMKFSRWSLKEMWDYLHHGRWAL